MEEFNRILAAIADGDPKASELLLPIVYQELRTLAAHRLRNEPPGQTLQATALVHEAYLRLVQDDSDRSWEGRCHFFAAASEAMRRILVENARRKKRLKHGGEGRRIELGDDLALIESSVGDVLAFNEALDQLAEVDPKAAKLVELRLFSGLGAEEAGKVLGISPRTSFRLWAFARAWLYQRLNPEEDGPIA